MKNLLYITIGFILLLCGCGTDATPDKEGFQPYKSGIWTIASQKRANWDGIPSKVTAQPSFIQTDTTDKGTPIYTSDHPENSGMGIILYPNLGQSDSLPHTIQVDYVDSSLTRNLQSRLHFAPRQFKINREYNPYQRKGSISDTGGYIEFRVDVHCDSTRSLFKGDYFNFTYPKLGADENGEPREGYALIVKIRIGDIQQPILDLCREQGLI